jgi:hypothetical protein
LKCGHWQASPTAFLKLSCYSNGTPRRQLPDGPQNIQVHRRRTRWGKAEPETEVFLLNWTTASDRKIKFFIWWA